MTARLLLLLAFLLLPGAAQAAALPRIIASADNPVPKCVQPAALMDFVAERNAAHQPPRTIDPRFANVADALPAHRQLRRARAGKMRRRALGLCVLPDADRDQLSDLPPAGRRACRGARASDNNFAGVGATVSGRPGEHFKDVATGVLAHLQHVLMYSTTRIPDPVAKRTRLVQNDVQDVMRRLAPAGDLWRSGARMDRHRPQQLRRARCRRCPRICAANLRAAADQQRRRRCQRYVYEIAASTSLIVDLRQQPLHGFLRLAQFGARLSTAAEAAATATRNASSSDLPAASAATRPPRKLSPAPTVLTASIAIGSARQARSPSPAARRPRRA